MSEPEPSPRDLPTGSFPRLTTENCRVTSLEDEEYNCIAWAAHDTKNWWEPGPSEDTYWPIPADEDADTLDDLIRAFSAVQFVRCETPELEPGYEKIALYEDQSRRYTHAARQLPTGKWTSKLGRFVDIEHDTPDDVAGGAYGNIAGFMKRPLSAA